MLKRSDGGVETLHIWFSNHEVRIEGHGLRELLLALQDLAVKWVRTTPNRYHSLGGSESGTVLAITIATAE
jgi:hypothetical protein